ncbi:MAG: tRNA (guanosine(37)-N1)-methyltransferase TrmD [Nitrospirae bacterium]|nr:tRNA (guanosine(37)-N1)-methyltransferase TrmD [Nitrospirota bacterium]
MRCDVLTLFPKVIKTILSESILKRAIDKGILDIKVYNIRDFTEDRHHVVDDYPYGGGAGMVLKPEPIFRAIDSLKKIEEERLIIFLSPQGKTFKQKIAERLSKESRRLTFICGHYEGIDERVRAIVDEELSLGDYVLTGGELAAMIVIEASVRLIPGVLGDERSALEDSFSEGLLDFPHYTRPSEFRGMKVPEVLLSGNHEEVRIWRRRESLRRTLEKRPDLLERANLSEEDKKLLEEIKQTM